MLYVFINWFNLIFFKTSTFMGGAIMESKKNQEIHVSISDCLIVQYQLRELLKSNALVVNLL